MKAIGEKDLKNYLSGKTIRRGRAIVAKCCDCMGEYADGKIDCCIPECPLYPFMPYKDTNGTQDKGSMISTT